MIKPQPGGGPGTLSLACTSVDPRRNYPQDPEPRWYQDDRGYPSDDRGYPGDDRGYGEEQTDWERRGDARHSDTYRVPEPRGNSVARPYVDQGGYPDQNYPDQNYPDQGYLEKSSHAAPEPLAPPARIGGDPLASSTGEMSLDEALGGRPQVTSHATEAMDRSQLRRTPPPAGATSGAPFSTVGPPSSANVFGGSPSVAAPTTAVPTLPPPAPAGAPKAPELGRGVYRSRRPALAAGLVALTVLFELPALRIFASAALASKVDAAGTISSIFLILGLPMFAMGLYGLITGAAAAAAGSRTWLRTPLAYLPVAVILFLAAALAA